MRLLFGLLTLSSACSGANAMPTDQDVTRALKACDLLPVQGFAGHAVRNVRCHAVNSSADVVLCSFQEGEASGTDENGLPDPDRVMEWTSAGKLTLHRQNGIWSAPGACSNGKESKEA